MRIWDHTFKAVQLSQNRTYEVMYFFLSKKVENSCIGTANGNNIEVIYIRRNMQPPYSHYMDLVSNDFTNNFGNMPLLVVFVTHLLATGEMARHVIHGIVSCLATSVAKVSERRKHSIKQNRCYNEYITILEQWSIFLFQFIKLVLLIGWPTYIIVSCMIAIRYRNKVFILFCHVDINKNKCFAYLTKDKTIGICKLMHSKSILTGNI